MTTRPAEAIITINGHTLTHGQSMTLRVAVTSYLSEMSTTGALGDDSPGGRIREGYQQRLLEILRLLGL